MRSPLRLIGYVAVALGFAAALAPPSAAYTDPPRYDGVGKAPKTAPPTFPTTALSAAGTFPDLLVDEAGTAHIVWNEGRGNQADVAVYCRLKRGASGCDARRTLVWNKTYGAGDGPQYNTDDGGPRIVRVGNQLLVLSKRYPTVADKPDGASSSTVVGWVSGNGGTTWSEAAILGKRNLGELAVVGPPDDPAVLSLAHDPFCGGMCLAKYESGVYSTSDSVLNTDPNSNYYGTLVRDGGVALGAFSDLTPRVWMRRWNGADPVTEPGNWSTSAPIPGTEPSLANGPAGPHMLLRPGYSGPLQVRKLNPISGNRVAPGSPNSVSPPSGARFGRLAQDPSGRLLAAWQQDGSGVQLRSSTTGAGGFLPAQRLIAGEANGQIALDAARDGGGFALLNHTGGVNSPGQIAAVGFGNRAATGRPGLAGLPGGAGDVSCQHVGFGSFDVETVEGCFLRGTGAKSDVVVTHGAISLNGLEIVPDPGARLVIDPRKLTLDTIGQARVLVRGGGKEVVLFHGRIQRDLSSLKPGARLFEFPASEYRANVFGFDVAAGLPVYLTEDGVRIPIDVELPAAFGGFTGHAELIAREDSGLVLDSLEVRIGPVPLGALLVDSLELEYQSGDTWKGAGKLSILPAGGAIDARFSFVGGEFAGAGFDYTLAPPATIGPFVYLLSVGGDFGLRPTEIKARASLGAGAAVAGQAPVKVNGQFAMLFPAAGPASFDLTGNVNLFMIRIGQGYFQFQTDGYAEFGGSSGLALGPLSGGVNVQGFVDGGSGQFGADLDGNARFCMEVDVPPVGPTGVCGDVGAQAAVSSLGFAACARINPPDPVGGFSAGLALHWRDLSPGALVSPIVATAQLIDSIAIPCSTSAYRIPVPRRASASAEPGAQAIAVPGGLPTATILVKGTGGAPDVSVNGPGGARITPGTASKAGTIVGAPGANATWVMLNKPPKGTWTVTPEPGSKPISEVLLSEGYEPAKVKGKVRKGKIRYRAKHLGNGQRISFRESGRFGTGLLGSVRKPRGTLRFKPSPGAGGKRKVSALILRDGLVTDTVPLGSYKAPPPRKPSAVRRLRVKLKGSNLLVSFRPARRAKRTQVAVQGKGGTELAKLVGGRKRKVRFSGMRWERKLRVSVQGISDVGRKGPRRTARVR